MGELIAVELTFTKVLFVMALELPRIIIELHATYKLENRPTLQG